MGKNFRVDNKKRLVDERREHEVNGEEYYKFKNEVNPKLGEIVKDRIKTLKVCKKVDVKDDYRIREMIRARGGVKHLLGKSKDYALEMVRKYPNAMSEQLNSKSDFNDAYKCTCGIHNYLERRSTKNPKKWVDFNWNDYVENNIKPTFHVAKIVPRNKK